MNIFIVISQAGLGMADKISEIYGPTKSHSIIPDVAWAVADARGACVSVCEQLGIVAGEGPQLPGVVIKADQYYGVYDPAFWQRIAEWQGMGQRKCEALSSTPAA